MAKQSLGRQLIVYCVTNNHVQVPPSKLELIVELEVKDGSGVQSVWIPHSHHSLALSSYSQFPLTLPTTTAAAATGSKALAVSSTDDDSTDEDPTDDTPKPGPLRARLCLETNATACGPYVVGVMVDNLEFNQPWLVALIVVVTLITLIGLLVVIKCFYKSHNSELKQVIEQKH